MSTAVVVLTVAVALVVTATGGATLAAVPDMRRRAQHLGCSVQTFRGIGALELLGAAALVGGLLVPALGTAAAAAVVLLMAGAVVFHARAGDGIGEMAPALVVGAAAAALLALTLAR